MAIKFGELFEALKRKIDRLGISQRAAAGEIGVSSSTVSRICAGRTVSIDAENIAKICAWLDVPVQRYMSDFDGNCVFFDSTEKLDVITDLILHDESIPDENKPKFIEIFSETYKQFARLGNGK